MNTAALKKTFSSEKTIRIALLCLVAIPFLFFVTRSVPPGIDWKCCIRPATLYMLQGQSPYLQEGFFNPPWGLIPLIPLALLPLSVSGGLIAVANLVTYGLIAHKFGAKPLVIAAILLSPPVLTGAALQNVDWLASLGILMPPQIGLFFVSIKPQVGVGIAIYWLVIAWQKGGIREVLRVFAPFGIVFALSLLIFGLYPLRFSTVIDGHLDKSLFPYSLPVGLLLLVYAIRKQRKQLAAGAGVLFPPYLSYATYTVSMFSFLPNATLTYLLVAAHWVYTLLLYFEILS